ncbi:unnamed protein product [Brassicogethes aeneus]|uniref:BZIP domain-containing protein n=1 Tax=Brassicogethes aeneus TaxID=1431903 RepID=A0A9P0B173_BRAAE|nr:unnamed protein product [Brassicogethes aeneus]
MLMDIQPNRPQTPDLDFLHCVNPHEVNPIVGLDKINTTEYQVNWNVQMTDVPVGHGFYGPSPKKVKLEMEEFRDLSFYLPKVLPTTSTVNTIDELNTPVFENDSFDFSYLPQTKPSTFDAVKLESRDYVNNQYAYPTINSEKQAIISIISDVSNNGAMQNLDAFDTHSNSAMAPPNDNDGNVFDSDCESPPYEQLNVMESPKELEDSNSSLSTENSTPLYLNLNMKPIADNINTPDVLDTVIELGDQCNFNILDLVQSEDIITVNAEDIFPYVHETLSETQPLKRKRVKKSESDEEYIPPLKTRRRELCSDSESDYEEKFSKKPRSPTKRLSSVDSRNGGLKYRDLRDKNNEASRKSRMKRREKEREIDMECEELTNKNVKLKAQVEELEKTVSSYRENLFKIMLLKK